MIDNKELQNVSIKLWELIKRTSEEIAKQKSNYAELLEKHDTLERFIGDRTKADAKLLSEIEQLKTSVADSDGQIHALIDKNSELSAANTELLEYKQRFEVLLEKYEETEKFKNNLESENAKIPALEKQIEALRLAKINADNKLEALDEITGKLARLEFDYKLMQKELVRRNQEIFLKDTQLNEIREGKAVAESSVYKYQKSQELLNSLYKQIDEKSIYIADAEEQLKAKDDKINELENIISELQGKLNWKDEQIADLKNIQSLNNESTEMLKFKDNELAEINSKLEKQSAILLSYEEELNALSLKSEEYNSKINEFEEENSKLSQNLKLKIQTIEDCNLLLVSKENNISELNELLQKEKELSKKVTDRADNLENLLTEAKYEIELLDKELENFYALKDENNAISNQIKVMSSEISELITEILGKNKNIENLKNELNNSESELITLRNKLESHNKLTQEVSVLQDQITELNEQIKYRNNDIKLLEVKLFEFNRNKLFTQEIESKLEVVSNQLAIKEIGIEKIRNKTEELENLLKKRYEQIQLLEEQLNTLLKERNEYKSTQKEIKEKIQEYIHKIDDRIKQKQ